MANAYTTPSDVFKPEVLGRAVRGYLYNNNALLGSGYIGDIEGAIWSAGGNTVTFPKITGIQTNGVDGKGSSTNPTNGSKVESKKFGVTSYTAACVSRLLSIAVDKVTFQDSLTSVQLFNAIVMQIAEQVRNEIDSALITEGETTTLSLDISAETENTISYDALVDALALWGDKFPRSEAALMVHSDKYADILKLAEIKEASYFGMSTMMTARVPVLAGLPVFVSDNCTVTDLTVDTYTSLIVRRNALRLGMRQDVELEIKTEPGNTMRYLDTDFRYIVDLEQAAQFGAIKLITI